MKPLTDDPNLRSGTLVFTDAHTLDRRVYPDMAEIAPGVWAGDIPEADIPMVGFHSWQRLADGTFLPVIRTHQARMKLTYDIGRRIGLHMPDAADTRAFYDTMRRLVRGGFVAAGQPSPNTIEIDMNSFWAHYQRTRKPGYWTPERRAKYRRLNPDAGRMLPDAD